MYNRVVFLFSETTNNDFPKYTIFCLEFFEDLLSIIYRIRNRKKYNDNGLNHLLTVWYLNQIFNMNIKLKYVTLEKDSDILVLVYITNWFH